MDNEDIIKELASKGSTSGSVLDPLNLNMDSMKSELAERTKEVTELQQDLDDARHTKITLDTEIQRELYETAASRAHLAELTATREIIDNDRARTKAELEDSAAAIKDVLQEPLDVINSINKSIQRMGNKTLSVADSNELMNTLDTNTGSIVILEGADGNLYTIDNRFENHAVANDTKSTCITDNVKPFRFFQPMNPSRGRHKGEIYSPTALSSVADRYPSWAKAIDSGVMIGEIHSGVRVQIHKVGDNISCWTHNRTDVSRSMPKLIADLQKLPMDFIVEGHIVSYIDGAPQKRSTTSEILANDGSSALSNSLKFVIYDILWLNDKDIHAEPFETRYKKLDNFRGKSKGVRVSECTTTKSMDEMLDVIKEVCATPGSDGAIMRLPSCKYELDGRSPHMMEFRIEKSLNVMITRTIPTDNNTGYIYECAVIDPDGRAIPVGSTFATNVMSTTGIIKVAFANIIEYRDPVTNSVHFKWIFPRVVEARNDLTSPDTVQNASDMAKQMGNMPIDYKKIEQIEEKKPSMCQPPSNQTGTVITNADEVKEVTPDILNVPYKLQRQANLNTDTKRQDVEYHLLLKMPTRILDIKTREIPSTPEMLNAVVDKALKIRWDTTGIISPRHKLNGQWKTTAQIDVIDHGTIDLDMSMNNEYEMMLHVDSEMLPKTIYAKRESPRNNIWTLSQG